MTLEKPTVASGCSLLCHGERSLTLVQLDQHLGKTSEEGSLVGVIRQWSVELVAVAVQRTQRVSRAALSHFWEVQLIAWGFSPMVPSVP